MCTVRVRVGAGLELGSVQSMIRVRVGAGLWVG